MLARSRLLLLVLALAGAVAVVLVLVRVSRVERASVAPAAGVEPSGAPARLSGDAGPEPEALQRALALPAEALATSADAGAALAPPPGRTVSVRVVHTDGSPAVGAVVELTVHGQVASAVAGDDGATHFGDSAADGVVEADVSGRRSAVVALDEHLAVGSVTLATDGVGWTSLLVAVAPTGRLEVELPGEPEGTTVEAAVRSAWLGGYLPARVGPPGARWEGSSRTRARSRVENGVASFDGVFAGVPLVVVAHRGTSRDAYGYVDARGGLVRQADTRAGDALVVPPRGSLRVHVPQASVHLAARVVDPSPTSTELKQTYVATHFVTRGGDRSHTFFHTDAAGIWHGVVGEVEPGTVIEVLAFDGAGGDARSPRSFRRFGRVSIVHDRPSPATYAVEIALEPARRIEGRVVRSSGPPPQPHQVWAVPAGDGPDALLPRLGPVASGAEGEFSLGTCVADVYDLFAQPPQVAGAPSFELRGVRSGARDVELFVDRAQTHEVDVECVAPDGDSLLADVQLVAVPAGRELDLGELLADTTLIADPGGAPESAVHTFLAGFTLAESPRPAGSVTCRVLCGPGRYQALVRGNVFHGAHASFLAPALSRPLDVGGPMRTVVELRRQRHAELVLTASGPRYVTVCDASGSPVPRAMPGTHFLTTAALRVEPGVTVTLPFVPGDGAHTLHVQETREYRADLGRRYAFEADSAETLEVREDP